MVWSDHDIVGLVGTSILVSHVDSVARKIDVGANVIE